MAKLLILEGTEIKGFELVFRSSGDKELRPSRTV
jgi:hypothetical protein